MVKEDRKTFQIKANHEKKFFFVSGFYCISGGEWVYFKKHRIYMSHRKEKSYDFTE